MMPSRRGLAAAALRRRTGTAGTGPPRLRRCGFHPGHVAWQRGDAGEEVEAVFVFHRHGDRAPNRHLGHPSRRVDEAAHWRDRVFVPDDGGGGGGGGGGIRTLSERFPPEVHPSQNGGTFLDLDREPFGFLTGRGAEQMREAGARFRRRHLHREDEGGGESMLDRWDVQAYSTNYLRTVTSVQCFLHGLMGRGPDDGRSGDPHERPIPVQVRDKEVDTLNAFEKRPRMMDDLVRDVIATEQFQRIDADARTLADNLSSILPGLRNAPQAFGGTPSGLNWVHAHDHFVCRSAHSVPLLARLGPRGAIRAGGRADAEAEAALAAMAGPVRSHLAWRFREWYRCPRLLAAVACPPFREIAQVMTTAASRSGDVSSGLRKPFAVYSVHDVTLIALLYAIGADFLVTSDHEGTVTPSWRWWPAYSSTVTFELVRLNCCPPTTSDGELHAVRVLLNGKALRLMPRMSAEDEGLLEDGRPPCSTRVFDEFRLMGLSDFKLAINALEEASEHSWDSSSQGGDDVESMERVNRIVGVDGG